MLQFKKLKKKELRNCGQNILYENSKGAMAMYAYMTSRVHNYYELLEYTKKCKRTKPIQVNIIGEIHLNDDELILFLNDFKKDQKWLIPYIKQMNLIDSGKWQCIMISSTLLEFPIIIYTNMCLYPQYVGILQ